jgi:hypothetical protein
MSDSIDSTNGNLGSGERVVSAILGAAFSLLALRRGDGVTRTVAGVTGAALLARSFAGHCAVKAAVTGESSLSEGATEQWRRMRRKGDDLARGVEVSLSELSARVDEAVEESFPASDPPAVHLSDEPPVNADDKWAASRAAERSNGHHKN